jgi:hypothetical protein
MLLSLSASHSSSAVKLNHAARALPVRCGDGSPSGVVFGSQRSAYFAGFFKMVPLARRFASGLRGCAIYLDSQKGLFQLRLKPRLVGMKGGVFVRQGFQFIEHG